MPFRLLGLGTLLVILGGTAAAQPPPARSFPKDDPDTPTVRALNRVLADPHGFHIPDIAKNDLIPVFLVAAGHSERFWEQANFKLDAILATALVEPFNGEGSPASERLLPAWPAPERRRSGSLSPPVR